MHLEAIFHIAQHYVDVSMDNLIARLSDSNWDHANMGLHTLMMELIMIIGLALLQP